MTERIQWVIIAATIVLTVWFAATAGDSWDLPPEGGGTRVCRPGEFARGISCVEPLPDWRDSTR